MSEKKINLPEQGSAQMVDKLLETEKDVIELSSGVVLKIKDKIRPSIIIDILSDVEDKRPEPPTVYVEAIGREEVNLDDPGYIDRVNRWETVSAGRIADALILLGTEIESIPKGLEKPEDSGWIDMVETLGFRLNRRSDSARYLAWVKHVAIEDQDDWTKITEAVGRKAGVTEADVQRAQNSFPSP